MPTMTRAVCGACGATLRVPGEWVGRKLRCKLCGSKLNSRFKPVAAKAAVAPAVAVAPAPPSRPEPAPWAAPPAAADDLAFADFPEPTGIAVGEHLQSRGWSLGAVVAVALLVLGVGVVGGAAFLFRDRVEALFANLSAPGDKATPAVVPPVAPGKGPTDLPGTAGQFPRRLLAIGVHNYLYLNPITDPPGQHGLRAWADRCGERLRVPKEQIYVVSDTVTGAGSSPPVRPVIEQTVERFLATCRPQDRVVLLFAGHGTVADGKAYLVPLDGELAVKETLIPLSWLYERLATSPARQKLLILDVCRYDPDRGEERPGAGLLAAEFEQAVAAVPTGVQVWLSCAVGQQSYEFKYANFDRYEVEGGLFLSQFFRAFQRGGLGIPKPDDPLPVAPLAEAVNASTAAFAKGFVQLPQTPKLYGTPAETGAAFDPAEPPPARFALPSPERLARGGAADGKLVAGLVDEIRLPPIKAVAAKDESYADRVDQLFPYSAEVLKEYADTTAVEQIRADADKFPLRLAVVNTIDMLRRHARGEVTIGQSVKNVGPLMLEFRGPASDAVKRELANEQAAGPGLMYAELMQYLKQMEAAAMHRDRELSKRWQAHFDYALAMLKARFVYINEYNLALGKIRKEELPTLDEKLHNGWRLASTEKLQSPGDVKDQFKESRRLLDKIVKEYPGTPWEVLAKRERLNSLGLTWQASSLKNQ